MCGADGSVRPVSAQRLGRGDEVLERLLVLALRVAEEAEHEQLVLLPPQPLPPQPLPPQPLLPRRGGGLLLRTSSLVGEQLSGSATAQQRLVRVRVRIMVMVRVRVRVGVMVWVRDRRYDSDEYQVRF